MRKIISVIIAAALLLSSAGIFSAFAKEELPGDVNGDGNVNSTDALDILLVSVGSKDVKDLLSAAGDIDGSGTLNSNDALMILQYTVGLEFSVQKVKINAKDITGKIGDSLDVSGEVYPLFAKNREVKWTSSDEDVASVDENGKVAVIGNGVSVITCTSDADKNVSASFKITSGVKATSVSLDRKSDKAGIGKVVQLKATVKPDDAYSKSFSWKSSDSYVASVDKNGKVQARSVGTATITCTTTDGSNKSATYTIEVSRMNVPYVNQLNKYPTGCEAASACMLLQCYGYNVGIDEMVGIIPRENLTVKNGLLYGPDIHEKFVGDPRGTYTSGNPGYGAFSPVVTKALQTAIDKHGGGCTAVNLTGCTYETLLNTVSDGHPAVVWATYNMQNPTKINEWFINGTGEYFSYPRGTHVMVLCGYDRNNVYIMDPYNCPTVKTFSQSSFKSHWDLLGNQAIVLVRNK